MKNLVLNIVLSHGRYLPVCICPPYDAPLSTLSSMCAPEPLLPVVSEQRGNFPSSSATRRATGEGGSLPQVGRCTLVFASERECLSAAAGGTAQGWQMLVRFIAVRSRVEIDHWFM